MSLDEWQDSDPDQFSQSSNDTYLLGFVIANIVGLQYYSGTISGREMVGLVRQPLNPYDCNAIKVVNTRTLQVGHIERSVASVLSPLIDAGMIHVEGIVPNSRGGTGNRYRIPCQVHIFAGLDLFDVVKDEISRGGLQLICDNDVSFGLSEAVVVKEKMDVKYVKSVDEIFKLVDKNVKKKAKMGAMDPPKEVIKSELFVHQKEGLGWMVNRENSEDLPPFWEEKNGKFLNVLTNYCTDIRPEPLRGGILADDMGLGKTLTLLSLIAFDKCNGGVSCSVDSNSLDINEVDEVGEEGKESCASSGKKRKSGRVSKRGTGRGKKRKSENKSIDGDVKRKSLSFFDKSSTVLCKKMTLVVCPPSVFSTWITQLEEHTIPGKLKTYMYYGDRTKDIEELKKYDVVLTTYSTLATEDSWSDSPVKKIEWWRVILDEAHFIKNANAQQSQAVTNLNAKRRWAVTGTPIQNGSADLFSLMAFLRFEPFTIKSYWQRLVQRPLTQGSKEGLSRLQVMFPH